METKRQIHKVCRVDYRLIMTALLLAVLVYPNYTLAEMSTPNFKIQQDVIGSFGSTDESANYKLGDTGGEVATGPADAVNFKLSAGFWQQTKNSPILQFAITDGDIDFGTLDPGLVRYDTAVFYVGTNAERGYVVEYFGSTLGFGSETIDPLATPTGSSTGTEQFGFNAVANTAPSVGDDPSGGQGEAAPDYANPNQFKFQSGDVIARCTGSAKHTEPTEFTLSAVANISDTTAAGDYATSVTILVTGRY